MAAMKASEGCRNDRETFASEKLAAATAKACAQGVDRSSTAPASTTTGACRSRAARSASVTAHATVTSANGAKTMAPWTAMEAPCDSVELRESRDLRPGPFGTFLNIPLTIGRVANAQRKKRKRAVT